MPHPSTSTPRADPIPGIIQFLVVRRFQQRHTQERPIKLGRPLEVRHAWSDESEAPVGQELTHRTLFFAHEVYLVRSGGFGMNGPDARADVSPPHSGDGTNDPQTARSNARVRPMPVAAYYFLVSCSASSFQTCPSFDRTAVPRPDPEIARPSPTLFPDQSKSNMYTAASSVLKSQWTFEIR